MTGLLLWSLLGGARAFACSIVGSPADGLLLAQSADAVVRAVAVESLPHPAAVVDEMTEFDRESVRFRVEEVLVGDTSLSEVVLPGRVVSGDDWNDHAPPYRFVRPDGRRGSCFASQYRRGGLYLLFLEDTESGLGLLRKPLAPVNEQLRGEQDPWLLYVKGLLTGLEAGARSPK